MVCIRVPIGGGIYVLSQMIQKCQEVSIVW